MRKRNISQNMDVAPLGALVRVYGRALGDFVPRGQIIKDGRRKYVASLWLSQNGLEIKTCPKHR